MEAEAESDRLRDRLAEAGICPRCLKEYVHDVDEPFAYCDCGTTEWAAEWPLIFALRRKVQDLKFVARMLATAMSGEHAPRDFHVCEAYEVAKKYLEVNNND